MKLVLIAAVLLGLTFLGTLVGIVLTSNNTDTIRIEGQIFIPIKER